MRKLIFAINLSVDACCDHSKFVGSDELLEYHMGLMKNVDLFLYGRKTYELMVPYWPDVAKDLTATKHERDFANRFLSVNKLVFTRSSALISPQKDTKFVSANLRDEVLRLKKAPGENILTGGVSIPSQLIALDLVDEYYFVIHPKIVGIGRRLLEDFKIDKKLILLNSTNLKSGILAHHYLRSPE